MRLAHLVLVEWRDESERHQELEARAEASWKVVVAAVLVPANQKWRFRLVHNNLQVWIHLLQRLNGAHMVQV